LGVFAQDPGDESQMRFPAALAFHPSGDLLVANIRGTQSDISRFDGTTGAYVGQFLGPDLNYPRDMIYGPDGRLYVIHVNGDKIRILNDSGTIVDDIDGVVSRATGLTFGPDGLAYYTTDDESGGDPRVQSLNVVTKQIVNDNVWQGSTVGATILQNLTFSPDGSHLYVGVNRPSNRGVHELLADGTYQSYVAPISANAVSLLYIPGAAAMPKNRGDVTEDLFVGADDLVRILSHWGESGAGVTWGDGDCAPYNDGITTGDQFVGADDYVEVLTYWGTDYSTPEPAPEPASLLIVAVGFCSALVRRR